VAAVAKTRSSRRKPSKLLLQSAAERKLDTIIRLIDEDEAEQACDLLIAMRGRYRLPGRYCAVRAQARATSPGTSAFVRSHKRSRRPGRDEDPAQGKLFE
jgi:hypothetical protein